MQGNDNFRLVVRRGPQPNQFYELNKDVHTLGRDITNDIVINDPEVSRHHVRLTRGAGGFTVEDLGSTNGTFVNGQRITGARPLRPSDMIGLGETVTLGYETAPAPTSESAEPGMAAPAPSTDAGAPPASRPLVTPQYSEPQYPSPQSPYQPPEQRSPYAPQESQAPQSPASYSYNPPYAGAAAPPQAPPAGDYEYDPYAVREEEPRNTTRWVLLGCAGVGLFCCCTSVLSVVAIDALCLWEGIPVVYDVLQAFGFVATC
ncbi:MAG: FHA domain-containing protein [Chloroflexi bacterium]|nr:FHA domain-containing protein [Chloroflexota bacterium]